MTPRSLIATSISILCYLPAAVTAAELPAVRVDPGASVFAVVTHKGGFAAGAAHDHLVTARNARVELALDPASPLEARFELRARAGELAVDDPDDQRAWSPRLVELGVLDEAPGEVSEKDRAKIRSAMLGKKQLAAESHPEIRVRLLRVTADASELGETSFPYAARLAFEAHGRTAEGDAAARYRLEGSRLTVEAVGTFRFTDFGIEPYSALLGAVKNLDEFHLYLHLEAELPASDASRDDGA